MATLSKHGEELGRIELLTSKIAYFSDGKILRNNGNGWKLYRKVKPGVDPMEAFQARVAAQAQFLDVRPCFVEFKRLFHSMFSFSHRYMAKTGLEMLGNDADGLWSELNDMAHIDCDISELVELCRLYEASCEEAKELKDPTNCLSPSNNMAIS